MFIFKCIIRHHVSYLLYMVKEVILENLYCVIAFKHKMLALLLATNTNEALPSMMLGRQMSCLSLGFTFRSSVRNCDLPGSVFFVAYWLDRSWSFWYFAVITKSCSSSIVTVTRILKKMTCHWQGGRLCRTTWVGCSNLK